MTYARLLAALCLCLSGFVSVRCLDCLPCDKDPYENPLTDDDCPWGLVKRQSLCCLECAKGPGNTCGGLFDKHGVCGPSLSCSSQTEDSVGMCRHMFLPTHHRPLISPIKDQPVP